MKWLDWLPPGLMLAGIGFVLDAGSGEAALGLLLALTAVVHSFKDSLRYKFLRNAPSTEALVVVDRKHVIDECYEVRGGDLDKAVDDAAVAVVVGKS